MLCRAHFFLLCLLVGLALAGVSPVHAALVNRWSFNNAAGPAASGATMTDSVGNAVATVRGNGSTFTGSGLTLTGSTTGNQTAANIAGYVDLPNGLISSKINLTVEIWAAPLSFKSNARLFDFGNMNITSGTGAATGEIIDGTIAPGNGSASDAIYVNFCRTTNLNGQRMRAWLGGTQMGSADSSLATTAGTFYHYVCTFEDGVGTYGASGGRLTWYRNAAVVATFDVNFRLSSLQDVNNWLGRSSFTADSMANATYDEVRIYNHALSQAEVSNDYSLGPNTLPAAPPTPDNLWTFTQQANSSPASGLTFTDSRGGMVLTLRGNNATLSGSAVTLPGTTTGNAPALSIAAYLDLPNGILSARSSMTFEAWATPLSSQNYQRLFDFGRGNLTVGTGAQTGEIIDTTTAPGTSAGYDNIVLSLNVGANLGTHRLEGQINNGAAVFSDTTAATTAGTQYHYVLVIEDGVGTYGSAGAQLRWYRNGTLQNTLSVNYHLSAMHDVNNWIGRSQYTGDNNSNLSLNELRIYNRAITQTEISASYAAGPDPSVGPDEPLPPVPVPENRWNFNTTSGNVPNGTAITDTATGTSLTVRGIGATTSGTSLVLPGTTNGQQTAAAIAAYVDLPNGFFSSRPTATYEIWVTPLSSKNWQRIFDFGRGSLTSGTGAATGEIVDGATAPGATNSYDGVMLSLNNGTALGSHRLESVSAATATTVNTDLSGSTIVGTEYHYALVVEDGAGASGSTGCQVRWYRNGVLDGSIDLAYRLSDLSDVNNWIGRSAWTADNNSNIAINDFRVHRRALSVPELRASAAAGPNVTFAPPTVVADAALIQPNQKVLLDVLKNDSGTPLASTLQVIAAPAVGTATVTNGKILYTHSGSAASPVTFKYRVANASGLTADGTVTISFATSLRITNPALAMPNAPPTNALQLVNALPGLTFNAPLCISSIPGDAKQVFICERMAKVQRVADVTATAPAKNIFLDVQAVVAGRTPVETIEPGANYEFGLLGLAFHPNYAVNGYFYAAYTVRINGGSYYERISRFKVSSTDPTVADPKSELILIQQLDEGANHNGGDLHFGPDGYLYYAAGDEENGYDLRLNSQKINKDFFSGIFRFDVDKKPSNLAPNPHDAIPMDNGVARFSVPIDNPFVHTSLGGTWDGTYNGVAVTPLSSVRMELYCTGLRHTWRFSIDSATGDIWAGDVGQDTYEEVDKIIKGGNYGWVYREGKHDTNFTTPVPPTKPAGFTSIDPIYEYPHLAVAGGDPQYKGNSICGGYVYRGTRIPALVGSYIFTDSVSGHVWQMNTTTGATVRITGLPGAYGVFSAMGVDPSNQDLLFCAYLNGQILRLTTGDVNTGAFPTTLSATGLFADLTDLSPSPGLVPYEPNLTFWSDYAVKRRWFTIPDATSKMTWSKDGNWTFPEGTVWVKHFDLELKRGDPTTKKRIETRVLVKNSAGSYGVSYRWNDAQTDATIVGDAGVQFDVPITTETGVATTERWAIPSRTDCLTCHNPQAGHALSFNTRQLNHLYTSYGYTGNELTLLDQNGFLSNSPGSPNALERHIGPDETNYPLEARARSYFAVNCAYCHRIGGTVGQFWDGRAHLPLDQTNLINGVAENNGGNPLNKYIVPGDPAHSIVLNRMAATNGFTRMPPLATSEIDQTDVALITAWINSGQPARPLYTDWRATYFAANDPNGVKTADPNGNGITNYAEYLLGNNPLAGGAPSSQPTLSGGTGGNPFTLSFTRRTYRKYNILVSSDLMNWQRWDIPENTTDYTTVDTVQQIELISALPKGFFKLEISEP